jgi:hypothetical protein
MAEAIAQATEQRKFTLPISPEYVAHWGLWESVREIYQNALDEADANHCDASIEYSGSAFEGSILIATSKGKLTPDSLVLGTSTKRDDPRQRGKFGEGYKLALLVLARLGHKTVVRTGAERWEAHIEWDETFRSDVLNVYVQPESDAQDGVTFLIDGVSDPVWQKIKRNIRSSDSSNLILDEPEEKGRIYVGGLYVATVKEFQCGYAFAPGRIKLDRDRGMVDGFDLAWETSRLWTLKGGKRATELLEAEAPDVQYVDVHAGPRSSFSGENYGYFLTRHGDAVPVSSQEEIERVTKAGLRWVLVPKVLQAILHQVKTWFVPDAHSPASRLRSFRQKHDARMTRAMKRELEEIIKILDPIPREQTS